MARKQSARLAIAYIIVVNVAGTQTRGSRSAIWTNAQWRTSMACCQRYLTGTVSILRLHFLTSVGQNCLHLSDRKVQDIIIAGCQLFRETCFWSVSRGSDPSKTVYALSDELGDTEERPYRHWNRHCRFLPVSYMIPAASGIILNNSAYTYAIRLPCHQATGHCLQRFNS